MVNIGLYIWCARERDNIGGLRGPLLIVFIINVKWLCYILFAGYDFVGIDFLEYVEDGPLLGVVAKWSKERSIAIFRLVNGGYGGGVVSRHGEDRRVVCS